MRSVSLLLLAAALLGGCSDAVLPEAKVPAPPAREVSHWPTYGTPGFWFTYTNPPAGFTVAPFDATLSPVVEVCRINPGNGSCGSVLATFTRTSGSYGRLVTVDTQDEEYNVSWPTGSTGAQSGQVYRVSVRVGSRSLGFMDVKMVTSVADYFGTDPNVYYPWVAGLNFTVSFSIRQGIAGSIQAPSSITLGVGEGVSISPTVLDLKGAVLTTEPGMGIQGDAAVLDSGMVTGRQVGTATLWVWWDDLMVGIPVTVTDTRRTWNDMATPDGETVRGVWGSSATDLYAASNTGVLRSTGGAWSYVPSVRWRNLYDVTGFSSSSVWGVGDGGTIVRYDGTLWTVSTYDGTSVSGAPLNAFARPARKVTLRGVWGTATNNVVAVGDSGTALVYNGSSWSKVTTGVTTALTDVWGTASNNYYATTQDGRILRFTPGASVVSGVQAPGPLLAIWGSSASNIYAVGEDGVAYRYNGTTWTRIHLPTLADLLTVWGASANEVYVGGTGGALYRWDGTKWNPEKRGGGQQIFDIRGAGGSIFAATASGISKR